MEGELVYRAHCKKSIVASSDIIKGEKITRNKVNFLRNEPGIEPIDFSKIEGKTAKRDIKKYENLRRDDY